MSQVPFSHWSDLLHGTRTDGNHTYYSQNSLSRASGVRVRIGGAHLKERSFGLAYFAISNLLGLVQWKPPKVRVLSRSTRRLAAFGAFSGAENRALALALALSLDSSFPDRALVPDLTFGVVVFSILVQGLTIKPLVRILRLS